jgi:hypothetical protein
MGKPELQRIGSTLNQLSSSSSNLVGRSASSRQECSFKIWSTAAAQQRMMTETVQPFSAQSSYSLPALPKFKLPSFSSHRHVDNPAFAAELLKTITARVATWQTELQQVLEQIQAIYIEGPIIDGWLESPLQRTSSDDAIGLGHVEVDRLVDYVQDIYQTQDIPITQSSGQGYRLCGLDADGKLWSRPCPVEQLPHVSLAIGRYQKLRQLLGRKQYLETRLSQTANLLLVVHDQLKTSL